MLYTQIMTKKKQIIIVGLVIVVASIAIAVTFKNSGSPENATSGTVVNVIDRQNVAENGYYGMTVKTLDGKEYTINATGYLNTPLTPESNNEVCVNVPKVKLGDKVTFNLPINYSHETDFEICYENTITGFYFTLQT